MNRRRDTGYIRVAVFLVVVLVAFMVIYYFNGPQ